MWNGQHYEEGEMILPYPHEPCIRCMCTDSDFDCTDLALQCQPVDCDNAIVETGNILNFVDFFYSGHEHNLFTCASPLIVQK